MMLNKIFLTVCMLTSVFFHTAYAQAYGSPINNEQAKKVAAAAIVEAKKSNLNMAVAVVDGGGHLIYFELMDGAQYGSVDVALKKAQSAAAFRRSTKFFEDAVAGGGAGLRFLTLPGAITVDGGYPLLADGKVIGAIGASGGTNVQDGAVAKAGTEVIK